MEFYQKIKRNFSFYLPRTYSLADKNKKLIKFGLVGVLATGTNLVCLYFFKDILDIWYMISAVLAFVVAFTVSFSFQKFWTFRETSTHKISKQAFFYFVVTFSSLMINLVCLYILVDIVDIHYLLSQLILLIILALIRFSINNFLIFNTKNETQNQ